MLMNARCTHSFSHTGTARIVVAAEELKTNRTSSRRSKVKQAGGMFTVKLDLNSVRACGRTGMNVHHKQYIECVYVCVYAECVDVPAPFCFEKKQKRGREEEEGKTRK